MLKRLLKLTPGVIEDIRLPAGFVHSPEDELPPTIETAIELLETARDLLYESGWSSERSARFMGEFVAQTEKQGVPDRPRRRE